MPFYKANVADILRASQRDAIFVNEAHEKFENLLPCFGNNAAVTKRKLIPILANCWYYVFTALSNRQTIGEEYAGIIRIVSGYKVPSFFVQFVWLTLFVGGERCYDKILDEFSNLVLQSRNIPEDKKKMFMRYIQFLKSNKLIVIRLHQAFFYINGVYYNISNNITGIKYVLLRQWMQNESYSKSFSLLGKFSIFYLLCKLVTDLFKQDEDVVDVKSVATFSSKDCVLCGENRRNTSIIPCGHLFCWKCIHDCLKYQNNCPICREFTTPNKVILLQNYV